MLCDDDIWMKQAIELGKQVLGKTEDNPAVGCLITLSGKILGKGMTQPPGESHAEISAFLDAEKNGLFTKGATLYSTVEPCTFFARTPPCTKAIIQKQIRRVVIGIRDPHVKVQGRGVKILQEAGIEVVENVCHLLVEEYLADWLRSFK